MELDMLISEEILNFNWKTRITYSEFLGDFDSVGNRGWNDVRQKYHPIFIQAPLSRVASKVPIDLAVLSILIG